METSAERFSEEIICVLFLILDIWRLDVLVAIQLLHSGVNLHLKNCICLP